MANLQSLLDSGAQVAVMVSLNDLQPFGLQLAETARREVEAETRGREMLTRDQVMEMLNVKDATLWRWQQRKVLIPTKIGGRVMYKRSDIDERLRKGEQQ